MMRLFLLFGIFNICHVVLGQNLMVIHQGNGTKLQIPLESIDSVRFATVPPPIRQKIFQNNGNILSLSVADIDSINYIIPNAQALATVSTQAVTVLSSSSAYGGGLVSSNGGSAVTQRGLCWSTSPNPTLANNFTVDGAGTGSFGSTMAPLQAATTYYVRAYAVNSEGTAYGNAVVFTTSNPSGSGLLATITTANVVYTSGLTANCGGNITADGGLAVTARGVCWASGTTPNINNAHTVDGAGAGSFSSSLTNLLPNTTYFVRAYATNDAGTSYGVSYAFTTHNLPGLTTNMVSGITTTAAVSGGNISSDGGGTITAIGVCWSTSQNPTISDYKTFDGSGTGIFESLLTGLNPNTTYYVRAYLTNSLGTAYGNQFTFKTLAQSLFNPNLSYGTLSDIDGNIYKTIQIGTQTWMAENLKTSRYRNGDPIPTNLTDLDWDTTTAGAYVIFNNDAANNSTYGKLYNFYSVVDSRNLCPVGWHAASDGEWTTLENFLGGSGVAGGKLKSTSSLWFSPNTGATNESGFSALPAGIRVQNNYSSIGYSGRWFCTDYWGRNLSYSNGNSQRSGFNPRVGSSVRCLKD